MRTRMLAARLQLQLWTRPGTVITLAAVLAAGLLAAGLVLAAVSPGSPGCHPVPSRWLPHVTCTGARP